MLLVDPSWALLALLLAPHVLMVSIGSTLTSQNFLFFPIELSVYRELELEAEESTLPQESVSSKRQGHWVCVHIPRDSTRPLI